jgi:hypothetical protein
MVYPVLLGRGKRFFSGGADPRELAFVSTKVTPTGVLINTYRHVGSLSAKLSVDALRNNDKYFERHGFFIASIALSKFAGIWHDFRRLKSWGCVNSEDRQWH